MHASNDCYVVVTPARNEGEHLPRTIRSMVAQTRLPSAWVIVNDGSTDTTAAIINDAASKYPWILPVHRTDRGFRKQGGGVIEAFYDGLNLLQQKPWNFLVKFDADLSFAPDYFERCLKRFEQDTTLGIGGGSTYYEDRGNLVCETPDDPPFHVRGATKIYRRSCWDAIGGLIAAPGWDGIDELKANMLGWTTKTFKDIPLHHHRATGRADGTWKDSVKNGISDYISGYHPLFMGVKCLRRIVRRPYVIGALGLCWGFCCSYVSRTRRVSDPEFIRYVRKQQMNKLFLKPSVW